MTDKPTLEEIEARLAECDEAHRDVLTGGYGVRLLEIAQRMRRQLNTLCDDVLENVDAPPDANCSCHISPPCSDCVSHSGLRELFATINEIGTKK